MENDKHFKELIRQAAEETADDFTVNIMQRLEGYNFRPTEVPFYKQRFFRVLGVAFVFICIALVALSMLVKPDLPFRFTPQIPANYFSQITWFIVVFWVVMLTNHLYHKRQNDYQRAS